MNEKITAHPQKEEREKVLKEIRQLENRKKILENKQRNEERRVRTRRLIERGAILEGIFPLVPDLSGAAALDDTNGNMTKIYGWHLLSVRGIQAPWSRTDAKRVSGCAGRTRGLGSVAPHRGL